MLDWLKRHDSQRVFIATTDGQWTFGETIAAVEARIVDGTEVVRPWPYFSSIVDLLAVMSKGSAVIVSEDTPDQGLIDAGGAASVVFTSGSSGGPKGVRLTRENWEAAAIASEEHLGHGRDDTWLLAMPLHHVAGLSIVLRTAHAGGRVLMMPGFDPATFAAALRDEVTVASVVPTMLARVLDHDPGPFPELRAMLVGGGPISDELLERATASGLPVLPTYGMTETAGQVATLRPGSRVENKAHVLPGVELRIEPDGRIAVRGPMVSPGYVGAPDRLPDGWLVSNDLGEIDEDGALRVLGRVDTIIVSGGENIDPGRVEAEVTRVLGVESALVVGIPSDLWGMEVVCLYVGDAEPNVLETRMRDRLPAHMVPKRWIQVAELPRTALGKPDRSTAARLIS